MKPVAASIDEYIAACPDDLQPVLQELRATIRAAAPEAEERISYGMPAFFQNGILVYFAPFKNHIGFFPTGEGVSAFEKELTKYETTKGTIHLPFGKPLPSKLITRIVKHRVTVNTKKTKSKSKKK